MLSRIYAAARVLLAAIMLVGALNQVAYYLDPTLFPALHPFIAMLVSSGYIVVPKTLELLGGLLLFTSRRALGLTLLWPVIVNIVLFHAFFEPRNAWFAPLLVVLATLASWPERSVWTPLVRTRPP